MSARVLDVPPDEVRVVQGQAVHGAVGSGASVGAGMPSVVAGMPLPPA